MKQEKSGTILMRGRRIPYRWTRKKVKNLNLRVHRDGTVTVSTPLHVSLGRMESFLLANEDFIFRALARWDAMGQRLSEEYSLCDGGQIPILGKSFLLRVSEEPPFGVTLTEGHLSIHTARSDPESLRRVLRDWMGRRMEEWMPVLCREALSRMERYGISEPTLRYRCMVSRWGSCRKATGEITFNKFLMCVPVRCVEYVVYHEMAHLVEANHSAAFYAILTELMPDWRARREELSPYGAWIRKL